MKFTIRAIKTYPTAQPLGLFDVELRVQWLEAKGNPLSRLAEWVETTDGVVYAGSAYRSAAYGAETTARSEAKAMLAQKQPRKLSGERAYRNRPLSDEQKASGSEPTDRRESNRQKSRIRVRIEHIFGYMSHTSHDGHSVDWSAAVSSSTSRSTSKRQDISDLFRRPFLAKRCDWSRTTQPRSGPNVFTGFQGELVSIPERILPALHWAAAQSGSD